MKNRPGMITIIDVAKEAGVSPMTVSRALHRPEKVAEATRKRVLAACDRLNYRPNISARSLRTKASCQVGVIIPDWRNAFWIDVVSGIEEILTDAGYQLLIANSNEESEKQALQIEAMLSRTVDGMLIAPSDGSVTLLQALSQANTPYVIIDRLPSELADVPCVTIDNEVGAYKASMHLIKGGHKRIGLLAGNVNLDTGQQRLDGYFRALQESGIEKSWQLVRTAETNAALVGRQIGYDGTLEFLEMTDMPTALLCTSNTIAIGALEALQESQIRIPADIAIVSFGNMEWTSLLTPPLTVITQPTIEMGRLAAQKLLAQLETDGQNGTIEKKTVLKPQLIVRGSSLS